MFVKLSLLCLYLRLSPDKFFRLLVYIMVFVSIAFGISSIFTAALQCRPLSKLWIPEQPGSCVHIITFYYANAAINIITDAIIYLMPIKVLWALQLPKRQRLGLIFLFSLGGIVVVASVIRLAALHILLATADGTWILVNPLNWSTIELHIAVFVTCGPSFKAFMRRYLPRLLGSSSYRRSTGTHLHRRDRMPPYGSYPLSSATRAGETKTVITAITKAKTAETAETESEENIVLPYHGIMRETVVNVDVKDGDGSSFRVKPGTAK